MRCSFPSLLLVVRFSTADVIKGASGLVENPSTERVKTQPGRRDQQGRLQHQTGPIHAGRWGLSSRPAFPLGAVPSWRSSQRGEGDPCGACPRAWTQESPRRGGSGGGFRCAAPQNGGSAGCWALPAPAGVDPQGSPPEGWPPNPLPPRLTLFTFAVAHRRLGPISSTASSMT